MANRQSTAPVAALRQAHRAWRSEIEEHLAPAQKPEAGVWERWAAARYLLEDFELRLGRELRALASLGDRLPEEYEVHAWALGELLQFLCRHLYELGSVPQSGPAFAAGAAKLIRAFEFWCVEVEAAVGTAASKYTGDISRALEPLLGTVQTAVPA